MDVSKIYQSSIGKKAIVALTGLILLGFVIAHLMGNMLVFLGQDALNAYAKKLRDLAPALWAARIFLLAAVLLHIGTSIKLTIENKEARPSRYVHKTPFETSSSARAMMISGLLIFAFLLYHLLHFTWRVTHPEISHMTDALGRHDVYSMVVLSFQNKMIAGTYIAAMFLLLSHLGHGIGSIFQSLGLNREESTPAMQAFGRILALMIFVGYISIPVSVLLGLVTVAKTAS